MAQARVRQHINPLNFRCEVEIPDWERELARPAQPREVDVGCAHGDFLVARAAARPDLNLIGLEIRMPMVERVRSKIQQDGLDNALVVFCNANTTLNELFAPASLRTVYVHFPDPWFKRRHHKRRIMTPAFVDTLSGVLAPGGHLRFQTDHGHYATEVRKMMSRMPAFEPAEDEAGLPATHREEWHGGRGDSIHKLVWRLVSRPAR